MKKNKTLYEVIELIKNMQIAQIEAGGRFLRQDVIKSTTGYSCPNCGTICSDRTLILRTDFKFEEDPNPHYSWDETHKCQKCETLYLLHNGT